MRYMKRLSGIILLLAISINIGAQQNRIEELEKKIMSQQQQINELETHLTPNRDQKAIQTHANVETPKPTSEALIEEYLKQPDTQDVYTPVIGYDNGFFIRSEDIELKLKGYIMWQAYINDRNTVQNNTFMLRRNRLDTQVTFYKDWHVRIDIGFDADRNGNVNLRIREANLEYTAIAYAKARIGVMKVPFSMEFSEDRTDQLAIAYSPFLTMDSIPRRDTGIMVYGEGLPFLTHEIMCSYFTYAFGIFNGDAARDDYDGRVSTNQDDDFLILGSARFYPCTKEDETFFFHAAFFVNDTEFREDGAMIGLEGLQAHEVYGRDLPGGIPGTEDVDDTNGRQFGFDFGGRFWRNNLRIEGEIMYVRLERKQDLQGVGILSDRSPLEMFGIAAGISYFFALPMGEGMGLEPLFKCSFTSIDDRKKQDNSGSLNPPLGSITDVKGQDIWEIVWGLRFHFNSHVRCDFNYIMYDLKETESGLTNHRNNGDDLLHSFLFQVMARW